VVIGAQRLAEKKLKKEGREAERGKKDDFIMEHG